MKIRLLRPSAKVPTYAHDGDSGADVCAAIDDPVYLYSGDDPTLIPTGVAIELPDGYEAQVRPRSSWSRTGVHVALGTIDQGFRGEIHVCVFATTCGVRIMPGDRIAQLVVAPVLRPKFEVVDELHETVRGGRGFGSTGVR